MLLPFDSYLAITNHFDAEMSLLADRHYSRRTIGARQFLYSGRKLVIRNHAGTILFGWVWAYPEMRMDKQEGYCCAIFRNESDRPSSDVILECEKLATNKWGPGRMFTYINASKIKSPNPGFCFKMAGWKFAGKSKGGLHLLIKEPAILSLDRGAGNILRRK